MNDHFDDYDDHSYNYYDHFDDLNKLPFEWPMPKSPNLTCTASKALGAAASVEQLVVALMMEENSTAARVLKKIRPDLTAEMVIDTLDDLISGCEAHMREWGSGTMDCPSCRRAEKQRLSRVMDFALEESEARIGTEHLLLGVLRCGNGLKLFKDLNLNEREIRQTVKKGKKSV